MTLILSPEQEASETIRRTLERCLELGERLLIVDSPPGAGKTALVETLVATGVLHVGLRVAVVAPRLEQTYSIARRLIANWQDMPIQMLLSERHQLPADLAATGRIAVVRSAPQLQPGAGVVIATVAKMRVSANNLTNAFAVLVCDEAYQVASREVRPLLMLADQIVLVGDPGQLPPLVQVDPARYEAARFKVHWPAPREFRRVFETIEPVRLPVSRRLLQDTVDVVQPSFYPQLPFRSAADPADRVLELPVAGIGSGVDRVLDRIASGETVVGLVLPARDGPEDDVDEDLASVTAALASRLIERDAALCRADGTRLVLGGANMGLIDAHVRSGAAARRALRVRGLGDNVMVDTPEIWQGLEREIIVVKHPLSGRTRFDRFGLEPGRWCVMLSRHTVGCVVVMRDGVADALQRHPHDATARASGADDLEWIGWRAHQSVMEWLISRRRIEPAA